ncbi:TRAP transporter substrate-binding protein DctP [Methylobacterium fujisawaense]|uniref:TRAP transporter substrate-binding protein n=1 Tax=Methylobacterium fujisawaense TaxID=107400 RepID=UPI002F344AAC
MSAASLGGLSVIDRRHVLAGFGAALATSGLPIRSRAEARPKVLRLVLTNGLASQTGQGASVFAERIATLSGGRMRIEIFPSGVAGGELETTQDLAKGALDLTITSSAGYGAVAPKLGVFDIPFLFRDVAQARAVLDGPIGQKALADLESTGLVGLAWSENGLRHLTTTAVPVRTPKDLVGLKIRVPQSDAMITGFRALGADARPLPFPDVYGALSAGEFQGQENPLGNIAAANFDRVQRYLCLTGHIYSAAMLIMSRPAYDALSEQERTMLRTAARAATLAARETGDRTEASLTAELGKRGMTVITDVDRTAFAAAAHAANPQFEAQYGKPLLDAVRAVRS